MEIKHKTLWFSRHEPTTAQAFEIGAFLVLDQRATALALTDLTTENYRQVVDQLVELADEHKVLYIAGVFPTLIMNESWDRVMFDISQRGGAGDGRVVLLEAHNETRSVEGGKPTFRHGGFYPVGAL